MRRCAGGRLDSKLVLACATAARTESYILKLILLGSAAKRFLASQNCGSTTKTSMDWESLKVLTCRLNVSAAEESQPGLCERSRTMVSMGRCSLTTACSSWTLRLLTLKIGRAHV